WPIGFDEADELLARALPSVLSKTRSRVPCGGHTWEVDEFHGAHAGLVVAEVELDDVDQQVVLPPWVGREVTGDDGYSNAVLSQRGLPGAAAPVYVASPLGFTEPGRLYGSDVLLPAMRAAGLEPLDPWDDPDEHLVRAMEVGEGDARTEAL